MGKDDKFAKGIVTFVNRVWQVEGQMKKRIGTRYPIIQFDDVPPKIRWTKNGKGILYLVPKRIW